MGKMTAVVAIMAVFSVAVCFIILGSISVELMQAMNIDEGQFGSLVMALMLTSCIVQIFIGPMVDKFGYKPLAVLGFIVTAGSMFLLGFAGSFNTAFLACILLGIGAMSLNTVGNTLIPVVLFEGKDPARASNFGNAFFGLGYVLTPVLFTVFLKAMSYGMAVSIFGILALVFLIFALTASYPKVSTGFKFSMAFKLLSKPAVLIAALALFCYISLEISGGNYFRLYMTEIFRGENAASRAALVLGLFGVGMMLGRFIASRIKNLTSLGSKVITLMALISVLTILMMVLTKSPALSVVAVLLTGFVFAPIFPTIVGVTFGKFDPSLYGSIFGIIFAVGLLGGVFVPKWIGNVAANATVQQSLLILVVMAGILFVISLFLGRIGAKQKSDST
jgi:fucose permease